jgi:hypothetical protein
MMSITRDKLLKVAKLVGDPACDAGTRAAGMALLEKFHAPHPHLFTLDPPSATAPPRQDFDDVAKPAPARSRDFEREDYLRNWDISAKGNATKLCHD